MLEVIVGILAALGGGSGLVALWKAWSDHRNKVAATEAEADERLVVRLENRVVELESRNVGLQGQLDKARRYITKLSVALGRAGVDIPPEEA